MARTARRDGTPERRGNQRNNQRGFSKNDRGKSSQNRNQRPTRSRYASEQQDAFEREGQQSRIPRDSQLLLSNAKPARRQHVRANNNGPAKREDGVRLQKVLAQAGVASRRHAEILIDAGRVSVNEQVVREQGLRVDPNADVIRVDGVRINTSTDLEYFVLNKPRGIHCTMQDELGRPCIGDILSEKVASGQRLFHVGRLDADTEGLLLLTNDGELANRLMHPRYEIAKTYLATVLGEADRRLIAQLRDGVELEDGFAKADYVQIVDVFQGKSLIRVELHEGRKHIVRRMLKDAGFPVQRLVRTKLHTIQLGEQKPGSLRALNQSELSSLYKAVGL